MKEQSILAGILIGFGVIINTLMQPPILGALLFSFGLLTIIQLQLPLYTGRIGFIQTRNDPLVQILLFNFIGIIFTIYLYIFLNPAFLELLETAASIKFTKSFIQMFIGGLFCGSLIHLAVKSKNPIITMGAIILFILMGAEHCIADFPYYIFIAYKNFNAIIKFILVIIGNSFGAIGTEWLLKNEN